MLSHLQAFQEIADQHGNRASGFAGYGASVQYVVSELRAAGYSPTTQLFEYVLFRENSTPTFARTAPPVAANYVHETDFNTLSYSASGDREAPVTAVDVKLAEAERGATTSGCEDADFAGFAGGDIALLQRGGCGFYDKALNAQEAGASAVVIFNQGTSGQTGAVAGTLGEQAQDDDPAAPDITIPVIGTSFAIGETLANEDANGTPDDVRAYVVVDATNEMRTSTNVLAETADGNADRAVVVGSQLDSVLEGPGINNNGSGAAFNLELATQMAAQGIRPANKVRFAFWGASEAGLVGATRHVDGLSASALAQVSAYLNFDTLGSPNHGKFVYDGAASIEQEFVDHFGSQGIPTEPMVLDGGSDYAPFQVEGIPVGGLFSGGDQVKTAEQQAKWGGQAGSPFDPNYREAGDTIDNLDLVGLEQLADGGAHVAAVLAFDGG